MDSQYVYYLGNNNNIIEGAPNLVFYDNTKITTTLDLDLYRSNNCRKFRNKIDTKLFHLLTNKETFVVNGIKFKDYNASIDIFQKIK